MIPRMTKKHKNNVDKTRVQQLAIEYWCMPRKWEKSYIQIAKELGLSDGHFQRLRLEDDYFKEVLGELSRTAMEEGKLHTKRLIIKAINVQEKALDKAIDDDEYIREGLVSAKMIMDRMMPEGSKSETIPQMIINIGNAEVSQKAIEDKT